MRKISRTRLRGGCDAMGRADRDDRPRGIPGAVVTSRPAVDLDLSSLLLDRKEHPTLVGSESEKSETTTADGGRTDARETVSLSDGTSITFVTID
ncbi:MAG TPA: hypothetical protein VHB27_13115 [Rhodopila sp.]|uniref:hypothetical protein n=1 Tax=Rhodopila sp. TaxID=2480087 RepID=UPI002CE58E2C|nr:hypothetical protein [Rhodopila sp.]HVY16158.1 hypothetical protein [Rhodopila sp.]